MLFTGVKVFDDRLGRAAGRGFLLRLLPPEADERPGASGWECNAIILLVVALVTCGRTVEPAIDMAVFAVVVGVVVIQYLPRHAVIE